METDLEFFERLMKLYEIKDKNESENESEITHIINPLHVQKIIVNKPKKNIKMKMKMIFE